jgi:hypothetical protein
LLAACLGRPCGFYPCFSEKIEKIVEIPEIIW